MVEPLYREDLDGMRCDIPGCSHAHEGPIYLHGQCHPSAGCRASYADGVLTVRCRACKAPIAAIAVATREVLAPGRMGDA